MPKGVSKTGVRMTAKRKAMGLSIEDVVRMKEQQQNNETLYSGGNFIQAIKPVVEEITEESDEEIISSLDERFSALEEMTLATAFGINRSLIISGSAGLGKSFGVEKVLNGLEGSVKVVYIKGYCRSTGLYRAFYENCDSNSVIVLDDVDSIFNDETSLNILKAACDSSEVRRINWSSETKMTTEDGEPLPRNFEFNGSVIFLTNHNFEDMMVKGSKLSPHFEALMSRSLYLDLGLKTNRHYMLRIRQVVKQCKMLRDTINETQEDILLSWIDTNKNTVRDLSLRTAKKAAILMSTNPDKWEKLARMTLCKNV